MNTGKSEKFHIENPAFDNWIVCDECGFNVLPRLYGRVFVSREQAEDVVMLLNSGSFPSARQSFDEFVSHKFMMFEAFHSGASLERDGQSRIYSRAMA